MTLGEQDRAGHGGASDGTRVAQGGFSNQNGKGVKFLDTANTRFTAIADKRSYTKELTTFEVSNSTALAFEVSSNPEVFLESRRPLLPVLLLVPLAPQRPRKHQRHNRLHRHHRHLMMTMLRVMPAARRRGATEGTSG